MEKEIVKVVALVEIHVPEELRDAVANSFLSWKKGAEAAYMAKISYEEIARVAMETKNG